VNNQQFSFGPSWFRRRSALLILMLALFGFVAFSSPAGNLLETTAQKIENTFEEEIENGRELMRRRRWEDALKSFKRANDLKGKTCAECFFLMANAYMGLDAFKNVIQSTDKTIELAGEDKKLMAQAYNLKGVALQKQSETKDQKKLQESEVALRQAAALDPAMADVHYNLGLVLMQQNRDPEGVTELKQFLEMAPNQFNSGDAQKMIDNPRRAREPFAPDFSFTTAEGEYVSLEELHGKVVLLDFWGTWCPPCVASVPSLRDLNKKYAKEPSFVMIGVSSDGDEDKWRAFTAKEKMVWPQYLDRDRGVQRAFGVRAFPTYIVIDAEGVIRYRSLGMGFEKEAALADAISKQVKLVAKSAPSN
jgi:peroxiredoxin/Tfp pilus assembly protein PilF